jgi:hypothetical protein
MIRVGEAARQEFRRVLVRHDAHPGHRVDRLLAGLGGEHRDRVEIEHILRVCARSRRAAGNRRGKKQTHSPEASHPETPIWNVEEGWLSGRRGARYWLAPAASQRPSSLLTEW